jgi:hypothetical protein
MKYSKSQLRLMAVQAINAKSQKDSRYTLLLGRIQSKTGMSDIQVFEKILELAQR